MRVVNLELVLLAGPDPVAGGVGGLDDAMIGERTVAEVELAGVDHEAVGPADDDPGDDRAAALVALGVEFGDAGAPRGRVPGRGAPGSVLSVDFSAASGAAIPSTALRRAVLSSSRQALTLIPSMVPPV